ncbi:MAG: hypothetical protein ABI604_15780 [Nitrospirota bacterium]
MTRARILQEVRRMRLEELYARRQQRQLTIAGVGTSMPRDVAGWQDRRHGRALGRRSARG